MTRLVPAIIAIAAAWALALGFAAGVPWSAPLLPGRQVAFEGYEFRPLIGAGVEDGKALGVGANAADGNALQSVGIARLHAADLPILRYRFEDFPRTLELALVFRRADADGDVQAVPLPWPGSGTTSVDLSRLTSAWRGDIVEIGFAEYPTSQLVPPSVAFRPFRLLGAQLRARSWSETPRLLRTAWFGYVPWNQASINALPAGGAVLAPVPAVALLALLALAIATWFLRGDRAGRRRAVLVAVAVAWVALDLRWLDQLRDSHRLTEDLYSGKPWVERARLQPDEDVAGFAQLVRQQLPGATSSQHILVGSDSIYTVLRLIYFLLPMNAMPLDAALPGDGASHWPRDTIVVLCNSRAWRYDDARNSLVNDKHVIAVEPIFVGGNLGIYRLRAEAG
jgi:hypothetical protein